jgi:hypothetical protein
MKSYCNLSCAIALLLLGLSVVNASTFRSADGARQEQSLFGEVRDLSVLLAMEAEAVETSSHNLIVFYHLPCLKASQEAFEMLQTEFVKTQWKPKNSLGGEPLKWVWVNLEEHYGLKETGTRIPGLRLFLTHRRGNRTFQGDLHRRVSSGSPATPLDSQERLNLVKGLKTWISNHCSLEVERAAELEELGAMHQRRHQKIHSRVAVEEDVERARHLTASAASRLVLYYIPCMKGSAQLLEQWQALKAQGLGEAYENVTMEAEDVISHPVPPDFVSGLPHVRLFRGSYRFPVDYEEPLKDLTAVADWARQHHDSPPSVEERRYALSAEALSQSGSDTTPLDLDQVPEMTAVGDTAGNLIPDPNPPKFEGSGQSRPHPPGTTPGAIHEEL